MSKLVEIAAFADKEDKLNQILEHLEELKDEFAEIVEEYEDDEYTEYTNGVYLEHLPAVYNLAYCYENGIGCIAFSPLAQGVLTGKYLNGIPKDSRIGSGKSPYLHESDLDAERLEKVRKLNEVAMERGQSLTQMALSWILRDGKVTSVLIGASRPEQILENIKALDNIAFSKEECDRIDDILA